MTVSIHIQNMFRDFARTGRIGKEALADFTARGWVYIDEYGSPHLTTHGTATLKNIEKGTTP